MKTASASFYTNSYVRREGNVIDLCEYRSRMVPQRAAAGGAVCDPESFHWEVDESVWHYGMPAQTAEPEPERRHPVRHSPRNRFTLSDLMEVCAGAVTLCLVVSIWLLLMM